MPDFIQNSKKITKNIDQIISKVSKKSTKDAVKAIENAQRVFVFGAGRSGLVAKSFAMRLVHLGKEVYFVGDTITPAISQNDTLVVVSGSGETNSVLRVAQAAKSQNARIVTITSSPKSSIGEISDVKIKLKTKVEESDTENYLARQLVEKNKKIMPMGTLFELSTMIYFDSIIPVLMSEFGISEKYMKGKHTNLE
ncbi:MAG: 6-phospho-3-hexuloisomerase [Parcubacteria group bacterium]|nr:6-phospho-3-hexuloisomerase [Parcubacteria group bacterium]